MSKTRVAVRTLLSFLEKPHDGMVMGLTWHQVCLNVHACRQTPGAVQLTTALETIDCVVPAVCAWRVCCACHSNCNSSNCMTHHARLTDVHSALRCAMFLVALLSTQSCPLHALQRQGLPDADLWDLCACNRHQDNGAGMWCI